jgi:hypothetical protein
VRSAILTTWFSEHRSRLCLALAMVRRRLNCPLHPSMSLPMSRIFSQERSSAVQDDCLGVAQRGLLGQGGVALFDSTTPGYLDGSDDASLDACPSLKSLEQEYDTSTSTSRVSLPQDRISYSSFNTPVPFEQRLVCPLGCKRCYPADTWKIFQIGRTC